jgi:hypothetical protein
MVPDFQQGDGAQFAAVDQIAFNTAFGVAGQT